MLCARWKSAAGEAEGGGDESVHGEELEESSSRRQPYSLRVSLGRQGKVGCDVGRTFENRKV